MIPPFHIRGQTRRVQRRLNRRTTPKSDNVLQEAPLCCISGLAGKHHHETARWRSERWIRRTTCLISWHCSAAAAAAVGVVINYIRIRVQQTYMKVTCDAPLAHCRMWLWSYATDQVQLLRLLLARLIGQHCFARCRLSASVVVIYRRRLSSSVTLPAAARVGGRPSPGRARGVPTEKEDGTF